MPYITNIVIPIITYMESKNKQTNVTELRQND